MKRGLCLAGGGIKGAAHIGAIMAMEENGITFDYIAGTSSGSIVATLFACEFPPNQIYDFFNKYSPKIGGMDFKNIIKIIFGVIFKQRLIIDGINSGEKIEKYIDYECNQIGIKNISQIKKGLLIPAVEAENGKLLIFNSLGLDFENNEEKYISKVDIGRAVRASCTYPFVFSPCPYYETDTGKKYEKKCSNFECFIKRFNKSDEGKKNLLDGGLKENIPWSELKNVGCNKIVSINFSTNKEIKCCNNAIEIGVRSFDLINEELTRLELENIDFLHTIKLENASLLDYTKIDNMFKEGYFQTKKVINKIKKYLYE